MSLIINDLSVTVEDKRILNNFNLAIEDGQIHVIMGPNGTGKSTLSRVILGDKKYTVTSGDILYDGTSLFSLSTDERARLGIFLVMQNPTSVDGVTNSEFLRTALQEKTKERVNIYTFMKDMEKNIKDLNMQEDMMHRAINKGFSGGERKKNEILQLKMLKPSFIILDELDSGLDIDSLKIVCENLKEYLKENPKTKLLMITHYPRILEYLTPDYVHILRGGKIVKTGDISLALQVEKNGYDSINDVSGTTLNE